MNKFQEQRLFIIENRINSQLEVKTFFSRKYKKILYLITLTSLVIPALGFINDKLRIEDPDNYDYIPIIYYMIGLFLLLSVLVIIGHFIFYIQSYFIIKRLENDKKDLLEIIKRDQLEFERFEDYKELNVKE